MVEILAMSFVFFVIFAAAAVVLTGMAYITVCVILKIEEWSDKYGGWVKLVTLAIFCYLACLLVTTCAYLGNH